MEPRRVPRGGYAKDVAEIEGYARGLGRRRPDLNVTVLRCANVIGPTVLSPMASYLRLPVLPTEKKVMVMEPAKAAGKPAAKQTVIVEPVKVAPARGATEEPGVARVVFPMPPAAIPTAEAAPVAKPAPVGQMITEPVPVRPAIPARQ